MVFDVVRTLDPTTRAAVRALVASTEAQRGHPVLDESRLAQALDGAADGLWAVLAWDDDRAALRAYVQATHGVGGWDVEDVTRPDVAADGDARQRLLRAVLDAVTVDDGGDVRFWVRGAGEADDRLATAVGLRPSRELRQLRIPLPAVDPHHRGDLATRPFVVGQDEAAWLAVNNRAFAWHPDQGGLTPADVVEREQEPWFDPAGFLLHEQDGRLAGFCWTKVHAATDPPLGEIYVIAVDPDFHGQGLGQALTLAGLAHLHRSGLTTGMLYVESTNAPAVDLYAKLGFTLHHADRVYTRLGSVGNAQSK